MNAMENTPPRLSLEEALPEDLIGRDVRVDWGERRDRGEIIEVRAHRDHGREIKIHIATEDDGFRARVVSIDHPGLELLGGDD